MYYQFLNLPIIDSVTPIVKPTIAQPTHNVIASGALTGTTTNACTKPFNNFLFFVFIIHTPFYNKECYFRELSDLSKYNKYSISVTLSTNF